MKVTIVILSLVCLATVTAAVQPGRANVPAGIGGLAPTTIAPPATLTQDIEELITFVPMHMIMKLVTRYLINDAEFQAVVRTLNSYDAFMVRMRFRSQPEVIMFQSWVRQQLLLSGGGSMEMEESMEMNLFQMSPYWANAVYGWQGFLAEFMSYYPQDLLRAHIDMKIAQNGIFAQFWARLKALKPVYERVLGFPETQRLINQLQTIGVDTIQLDTFIRTQFDWVNLAIAPSAEPAAPIAPAVPSAQAPIMG